MKSNAAYQPNLTAWYEKKSEGGIHVLSGEQT